jgi:hypothetical protein
MEAKTQVIEVVLVSNPSKVMTKKNGKNYVLFNGKITSEKGKGLIVPCTFTFSENKETPSQGEIVSVIYSVVPSTKEPGKFVPFFEIGNMAANSDDIISALGVPASVEEQVL